MLSLSPYPTIPYRGRFAPTPSGPLHQGSLIAALGCALEAAHHQGEWLLRIEDVDAPRTAPGAEASILRSLEAHGLHWHGPVIRQSDRLPEYAAALQQLIAQGDAYPCACSRKELSEQQLNRAIDGAPRYPGHCRQGIPPGKLPAGRQPAWRLRVPAHEIAFMDSLLGLQSQQLERDVGDFVLLRADGQFAYQLAVVVDDAWQRITHVVRGADLLDSTCRQLWLQHCLAYPQPDYLHLPVATNAAGEKLSKQTLAPALDNRQAPANLVAALTFLGQQPPIELARADVATVWQWAREHWQLQHIPARRGIPLPTKADDEPK
jgi:glutamyl-Q tRNA(Asp) synthetase